MFQKFIIAFVVLSVIQEVVPRQITMQDDPNEQITIEGAVKNAKAGLNVAQDILKTIIARLGEMDSANTTLVSVAQKGLGVAGGILEVINNGLGQESTRTDDEENEISDDKDDDKRKEQ